MVESRIVILDVGKTMAKLTLWTRAGEMIARETRANIRIDTGPYLALDVDGIENWIAATLAAFARRETIGAIVPVGHGAAAAIVRDGRLAAPPMDYEVTIPPAERADYDTQRSPFADTGSPALPDGLNLGAQLHWLETLQPGVLRGDAQILLWPQYWAWRLSGIAAAEVTSLGCHTDLWDPIGCRSSALAQRRGWADRLPPIRSAGDALGPVTPEWRVRTGVPATAMVHCGLHDSNAALVAARGLGEIADHEATILSTGTWFVAMRSPATGADVDIGALSEARDCLVNVDIAGRPVPSARFMGGREIEVLTGLDTRRIDIVPDQPALLAAVPAVTASGARVLPTFVPGFGPFPRHVGRWIDKPDDYAERRAAVSLYAALVADEALRLIGTHEKIVVEGRFADAEVFIRALAALRPADTVYRANAHNDVSFGALRVLDPSLRTGSALERIAPLDTDLSGYHAAWRRDVTRIEALV